MRGAMTLQGRGRGAVVSDDSVGRRCLRLFEVEGLSKGEGGCATLRERQIREVLIFVSPIGLL